MYTCMSNVGLTRKLAILLAGKGGNTNRQPQLHNISFISFTCRGFSKNLSPDC